MRHPTTPPTLCRPTTLAAEAGSCSRFPSIFSFSFSFLFQHVVSPSFPKHALCFDYGNSKCSPTNASISHHPNHYEHQWTNQWTDCAGDEQCPHTSQRSRVSAVSRRRSESTQAPSPCLQYSILLDAPGTYILQDNLHLATPPPHPQDPPVVNPNPLATTPTPPKVGIKLTICITSPRKPSPQLYRLNTSASTRSTLGTYSIRESEKESRSSHETNSNAAITQLPSNNGSGRTPVFGEGNILLTPIGGKEGVKRKKPKTNLVKSNSQFISRVIPHDSLNKRLQEHNPEAIYVFANIDRAFQWLDLSSTPARV